MLLDDVSGPLLPIVLHAGHKAVRTVSDFAVVLRCTGLLVSHLQLMAVQVGVCLHGTDEPSDCSSIASVTRFDKFSISLNVWLQIFTGRVPGRMPLSSLKHKA